MQKFILSDQPYMHWNVNTIDTHSPTCFSTNWVPSSGSPCIIRSCRSPYIGENCVTTLTDIKTPWWCHSRSAETWRRMSIYCAHISEHVRLVWWIELVTYSLIMNWPCLLVLRYDYILPFSSFTSRLAFLLVSDSFCASLYNIYILFSKWTSLIYEASLFKSVLIFFKLLNGFLDTG